MKKTRESVIPIAIIIMIISAGVLLGVLYYLLKQSTPETLRWWAGISTLLCPGSFVIGLFLGTYGARREIAGIRTGLGEVVKAAGSIVDLRGQAAASIRKGATTPVPTQEQLAAMARQRSLDLSPVDEGPEFEIDEFDIGSDGMGSRAIQA
jgi:hypothetical protein